MTEKDSRRNEDARRSDDELNDELLDELDEELNDELDDYQPILDKAPRRSSGSQWGEPTEPPVEKVSFEELMELQDELSKQDVSTGDLIKTQDTDGSTTDPALAQEQGLVYFPPNDPPVVPSDDLQGVEIAAGFATSMEDVDLDVLHLPDRVDDNDADLEENVRTALRYNSETMHLDNVRAYVRNGIVYLRGTVVSEDDITIVDEMMRDIDAVIDVNNELEVAESLG